MEMPAMIGDSKSDAIRGGPRRAGLSLAAPALVLTAAGCAGSSGGSAGSYRSRQPPGIRSAHSPRRLARQAGLQLLIHMGIHNSQMGIHDADGPRSRAQPIDAAVPGARNGTGVRGASEELGRRLGEVHRHLGPDSEAQP
jgi:hypothetical protein